MATAKNMDELTKNLLPEESSARINYEKSQEKYVADSAKISKLDNQINQEKAELQNIRDKEVEFTTALEESQNKIASYKSKIEKLQKTFGVSPEEFKNAAADLTQEETNYNNIQSRFAYAQKMIEDKEKNIGSLTSSSEKLQADFKKFSVEHNEKLIVWKREELKGIEESYNKSNTLSASIVENTNELKAKKSELLSKVVTLDAEGLSDLQVELKDIEEKIKNNNSILEEHTEYQKTVVTDMDKIKDVIAETEIKIGETLNANKEVSVEQTGVSIEQEGVSIDKDVLDEEFKTNAIQEIDAEIAGLKQQIEESNANFKVSQEELNSVNARGKAIATVLNQSKAELEVAAKAVDKANENYLISNENEQSKVLKAKIDLAESNFKDKETAFNTNKIQYEDLLAERGEKEAICNAQKSGIEEIENEISQLEARKVGVELGYITADNSELTNDLIEKDIAETLAKYQDVELAYQQALGDPEKEAELMDEFSQTIDKITSETDELNFSNNQAFDKNEMINEFNTFKEENMDLLVQQRVTASSKKQAVTFIDKVKVLASDMYTVGKGFYHKVKDSITKSRDKLAKVDNPVTKLKSNMTFSQNAYDMAKDRKNLYAVTVVMDSVAQADSYIKAHDISVDTEKLASTKGVVIAINDFKGYTPPIQALSAENKELAKADNVEHSHEAELSKETKTQQQIAL